MTRKEIIKYLKDNGYRQYGSKNTYRLYEELIVIIKAKDRTYKFLKV